MLSILLSLLLADGARVEATPIPRDQKPNFSSMQFLLGSWECSVKSARRPRPFATHETISISADGYWLVTRTVTDPVPWNNIRITNIEYMTYDTTTQRWIDMGMDDHGAYDVSASPGWSGDAMRFDEIAYPKFHGVASNEPRVLRKVNDSKTEEETALVETNGGRVEVTTTCTKQS
jgi:hypothetical protein